MDDGTIHCCTQAAKELEQLELRLRDVVKSVRKQAAAKQQLAAAAQAAAAAQQPQTGAAAGSQAAEGAPNPAPAPASVLGDVAPAAADKISAAVLGPAALQQKAAAGAQQLQEGLAEDPGRPAGML